MSAKVLAVLLLLSCATARAQDRFEIQVYDSTTAPQGGVGLETHVNHVFDDVVETHVTFEPHVGLLAWLELGGYFQTALRADGTLDYGGVKLRLKARSLGRWWDGRLGLALNGELSLIPARYEANRWGTELRPIADLTVDRLYVSVNPIIDTDLAGDLAGHPQLQPAAKVAVRVVGTLALGAEAYTGLGPVDGLGTDATVRVLGVVDWSTSWLDLNVGVGWGAGSEDHWVAKAIIGVHPPE